MLGSFLALASIALALLANFPASVSATFISVAAFAGLFGAIYSKARPSLILLASLASFTSLFCLPSHVGIDEMTAGAFPPALQNSLLQEILLCFGGCLATLFLFWISARRQSGGFSLAAQEASEDIARALAFVGKGLSLFLLIAALFTALHMSFPSYSPLAFITGTPEAEARNLPAWLQNNGLLLTIFLLVSFAYMQDSLPRWDQVRQTMTAKKRALLEATGAFFVLMPAAVIGLNQTWEYMRDRTTQLASLNADALVSPQSAFQQFELGLLTLAFLLIGLAICGVFLRSLAFLFGPHHLKKRASSHVTIHRMGDKKASKNGKIGYLA